MLAGRGGTHALPWTAGGAPASGPGGCWLPWVGITRVSWVGGTAGLSWVAPGPAPGTELSAPWGGPSAPPGEPSAPWAGPAHASGAGLAHASGAGLAHASGAGLAPAPGLSGISAVSWAGMSSRSGSGDHGPTYSAGWSPLPPWPSCISITLRRREPRYVPGLAVVGTGSAPRLVLAISVSTMSLSAS